MLRHEPFTHSDSVSPAVKALVSPHHSWTGYFGMPTAIRYSFFAADDINETASLNSNLPSYANKTIGIGKLDSRSIRLMEATFRLWENVANVMFIKDEKISQLPIYTFRENSNNPPIHVAGFGEVRSIGGFGFFPSIFKATSTGTYKASLGIGINVAELQYGDPILTSLFLHESGHASICLQHPFAGRFALNNSHEKLTSYSVMNYAAEQTRDERVILPMSPLPADIKAAQFIFGKNLNYGIGNDVYDVTKFFSGRLAPGISRLYCLGSDAGGSDTLNAANVKLDAHANLNRGTRSWFGYEGLDEEYVVIGDIDIENYIGSRRFNTVVLNSLNNIIDIRNSRASSLETDTQACGDDIIIGFNPRLDDILFQFTDSAPPQYKITALSSGSLKFNDENIFYTNATKIEFDQHNSLTLTDITPEQLKIEKNFAFVAKPKENSTPQLEINKKIYENLYITLIDLPKALLTEFISVFCRNGLMFALNQLTYQTLKEYHCSDLQIQRVQLAINVFFSLYRNPNLLSGCILLTNQIGKYLGWSDRKTFIATTAVATAITIWKNPSLAGVANCALQTTLSFVSTYANNRFCLWAASKFKSKTAALETEDKVKCAV